MADVRERAIILIEVEAEHLQDVAAAVQGGLRIYYDLKKSQPFAPVRLGIREVHQRVMDAFNHKETE